MRAKFGVLAERFVGFEQQLDARKQQKKDDQEKRIAELHREIDDLRVR